MRKFIYASLLLGCLVLMPWAPIMAQGVNEIGIDRSNLTWESEAVQERTLWGIHALHATWFRDALEGANPNEVAAFVNEVRLAKQNNLKFLVNIVQRPADYDDGYQSPNAGADFDRRCGWPQGSGELSKINPDKFARRLRTQFDAVKTANLTIDAYEIGNEVDWICLTAMCRMVMRQARKNL